MHSTLKPRFAEPHILLVDPNRHAAENLKSTNASTPWLTVHEGRDAQRVLGDRSIDLLGMVVSTAVQNHPYLSVVRSAYQHRPSLPIVLVEEPERPSGLQEKELRHLGIRKCVPREQYSLQEILKIVAPLAISFKASEALAQASNDPLHSEVSKEDSEFSSVRARDFLSGSQVIFDLYVRLGNGKYLKLLQAGDAFTVERLEGYLEKGVTHFYLRKETQEEYLRFCDHLASSILKIQKVPLHVQTAQILNHGEQVMGFFQNQGLSPLNMDYAKKFLANVGELLKRMDLEGNELFEGFFQDVAAYEHGVGTTMLASVLAEYLEIQMDKPLQIVGVAGMFHDIGLQELPEALRDEGRIGMGGSLSPQERILYQSHPKRGGEILSRLRGIEAGAIQAVEQHHMRTRGPGFPERNGIAPMNRVAEMIGISDEMNLLLKRKQADPSVEILMELERKVFPNFSRQITYAFRTAFFPRST